MAAAAPAHMWFVKTGGEVWGPYPQDRVASFAREGRVRAATLLSPFVAGPWTPAGETAEFAAQFRSGAEPLAAAPSAIAPPAATPVVRGEAVPEDLSARMRAGGAERAVLVFAELSEEASAAFEAALERIGRPAAVRPGLWLVRTALGAAAMRNRLSSGLGGGDALLVVEAPLEQAAWFNLAPERERALRRLWAGE